MVSAGLVVRRGSGRAKCDEEGHCRQCLRAAAIRPLTRHHLVPLDWFESNRAYWSYRNVDANIIPLCWPCHREIEKAIVVGWFAPRAELRAVLAADEIAFAIQVAGQEWLDHRYPEK